MKRNFLTELSWIRHFALAYASNPSNFKLGHKFLVGTTGSVCDNEVGLDAGRIMEIRDKVLGQLVRKTKKHATGDRYILLFTS